MGGRLRTIQTPHHQNRGSNTVYSGLRVPAQVRADPNGDMASHLHGLTEFGVVPVIRVDKLNFMHTDAQKDCIMQYALEFKLLGACGVVVGAHTMRDGQAVIDTDFLSRYAHYAVYRPVHHLC